MFSSFTGVPRHQARVVKLQYCGEGPIKKTLMLVGKVRLHSYVSALEPIKSLYLNIIHITPDHYNSQPNVLHIMKLRPYKMILNPK